MVDYLAAQLGNSDPSVVKRCTERVETTNAQASEIRVVYGHPDWSRAAAKELAKSVFSRAWTHGEGLTTSFEHETTWLRSAGGHSQATS